MQPCYECLILMRLLIDCELVNSGLLKMHVKKVNSSKTCHVYTMRSSTKTCEVQIYSALEWSGRASC